MNSNDITPRQVIDLVENSTSMTPMERKKCLAVAFVHLVREEQFKKLGPPAVLISVLWEQSRMINPQIPEFDPEFIVAINSKPSDFVNVV